MKLAGNKLLNKIKNHLNFWSIGSTIIVFLILLPNINLFLHIFEPPSETWLHIKKWLLPQYVQISFILVLFSVFFSIAISAPLAWFVVAYDFPAKKFFSWAFVLPLAFPPYIGAYTYNGMLGYGGSLPVFLNDVFSVTVKPVDIMSLSGAIYIFSIFLFPYIYLITKAFWEKQSSTLIESGRLLGYSSVQIFFRLVLPLSRAALISGSTLVALEVLSDYGVVSYFGVKTFSTAIFRSWISFTDIDSALKLSAILLLGVMFILFAEKILRGKKRYAFSNTKVRPLAPTYIRGLSGWFMFSMAALVFFLSFALPFLQLVLWSILSFKNIYYIHFFTMIKNSFLLAFGVSLLTIAFSLILANFTRQSYGYLKKIYSQTAIMGYAIPGAVVAIAVIVLFIKIPAVTLLGIGMIFALVIRFLSVAYQSIENGYAKTGNSFTEAARSLGRGLFYSFFRVDVPLLWPSILSAFAFVFLDVMKELPIVLLLRPFNFYSLSTRVFDYANDEMIPESSLPSLIIIAMSMVVMFVVSILEKTKFKKRKTENQSYE